MNELFLNELMIFEKMNERIKFEWMKKWIIFEIIY